MTEQDLVNRFEQAVLPHLDAAFNLARWLTRNEHDAEDLVQESSLRAFKSFAGFRGGDSRTWLLTIVRNTCYTWLRQNRAAALTTEFDEEIHRGGEGEASVEARLVREADNQQVQEALEQLPPEFREAIVLRELEGLSYKEIADVAGIPIGTVMSRLARARKWLESRLGGCRREEARNEL